MTDKQVIIDGVDVSGCEHINTCDNKIKCVILQDDVCETNPYCEGYNCYYKQLKRKEQECEELKAKIKYIEEYIKTVENARNEFEKKSNFLKEENKRLKQTLAEIKEIAKKEVKRAPDGETFARPEIKKILQKISEVKK